MDHLIIASLEGTATPDEEERLRRWREASPENERLYEQTAQLWQAIPSGYVPVEPGPAPDPADLIRRAGTRRLPRPPGRGTPGLRTLLLGVIAGTGVIAAGLLALLVWRRPGGLAERFAAEEFATSAKQLATVKLRDGTVVRLGPRTRLRLTGGDGNREVALEGRAYFAVAHDPGRPFRIRTAAGDVTVLGTRFELQARSRDLSLIVVEGRVELTTSGSRSAVRAGEMERVLDGTTLPVQKVADIRPPDDWMGNFLVFRSTPLRQASVEIGRRFNVRVEITDSALAEQTITAVFSDLGLPEIMRVVCAASMARWSENGRVIRIERL